MQKSGDSEWRKRISKPSPESSDADANLLITTNNIVDEKPSSIADRLKVLENAQLGWKKRVNEADAVQFTVAGKMGATNNRLSPPSPSSPLPERPKKVPKPVLKFRSKGDRLGSDELAPWSTSVSSPGTPSVDDDTNPFKRSSSQSSGADQVVYRVRQLFTFPLLLLIDISRYLT